MLCAELRVAQRFAVLGRLCHGDGAFLLDVSEDLSGLRRADDACALYALERDAVQSAAELDVTLAGGASAGEYRCLFHVAGLRSSWLLLGSYWLCRGLGVNQKAPILGPGLLVGSSLRSLSPRSSGCWLLDLL